MAAPEPEGLIYVELKKLTAPIPKATFVGEGGSVEFCAKISWSAAPFDAAQQPEWWKTHSGLTEAW